MRTSLVRVSVIIVALTSLLATSQLTAANKQSLIAPLAVTPSVTPGGAACVPSWQIVPSPDGDNHNGTQNFLGNMAAISTSDVWVVGASDGPSAPGAITEHWNRSAWQLVATPPGPSTTGLGGVTAIASDDVWAVGDYLTSSKYITLPGETRPFAIHWNGTAWQSVPVPYNPHFSQLVSVTAIASNDVWAAGTTSSPGSYVGFRTLIEHWDGSAWSIIPSPGVGDNELSSISARAANDVWAVGYYSSSSGYFTLTLHWDGASWSVVPSPTNEIIRLNGVTAIAANNVWAVGYSDNNSGSQSLIEHWNGSNWQIVTSPAIAQSSLYGVAAAAPNDVWAVGSRSNGDNYYHTLTLHWNGSVWSYVPSPSGGTNNNLLGGVVALSSGDVWTAGYFVSDTYHTLTEHYAPAASTSFSDVPPSYTFYADITYLACSGAVSGYPDGSFHPDASASRAQFAHIVVAAFNSPQSTPSTPNFSDVPPTSPFYTDIETAHAAGLIDGFPDGTFRPNAAITRAQVAKIVRRVRNYPLPTYTTPPFADVAVDNPFYSDILDLYQRGIVSGISCGQSLCYLPNAPINRGELSAVTHCAIYIPTKP